MKCSEVQKRQSAYIEGIISAEERVLIDEHLKTCQRCKESLADLRKTVEYIQKLEEIEPPAWLTQRVMVRVRSEAEPKRGILQRLFYPLHIKVPIEAVTAILIAMTTIYIFKGIQPEIKLAKVPSQESTSRMFIYKEEKTHSIDEDKPAPEKRADQFRYKAEKEIPSGEPIDTAKSSANIKDKGQVAPPSPMVKQYESKRKDIPYELRARSLMEKNEQGISFVIDVKDIETARKEIEKIFTQLGGEVIKREYTKERSVIIAKLDSVKVNTLYEKLKHVGEVKGEAVALKAQEGEIEIKIELL